MLKQFPGRTLEDLDDMDWLRFRRAQDAQKTIDIEDTRQMHRTGKLKEIDDDMLTSFIDHDRLIGELE